MSFAGFNSSKFVKGRLQAALYSNRKKRRARAAGGGAEPVEIFFGAQTGGGGGNWGASTDRAMFRQLSLVSPNGSPLTVRAVHIRIRLFSGSGDSIKGLVYGAPGLGGARLGVSPPLLIPGTGYHRLEVPTFEVASGTDVWAGAVWSDGAFQCEFDSEAVAVPPNSIMFNGTFDYTNPPATAPASADATYANTLAAYLECSYIPD